MLKMKVAPNEFMKIKELTRFLDDSMIYKELAKILIYPRLHDSERLCYDGTLAIFRRHAINQPLGSGEACEGLS